MHLLVVAVVLLLFFSSVILYIIFSKPTKVLSERDKQSCKSILFDIDMNVDEDKSVKEVFEKLENSGIEINFTGHSEKENSIK